MRHVCIHAHFYQPPRENAWSGGVERQASAAPFHDWNERITAECYRPNSAARRLDAAGRIVDIQATWPWISFNFGPTLLGWLERSAPEVYAAVLQADRESQRRFGGHGSALAQAFHHTILPLEHPRDLATQVEWGVRDFQRRFGRDPEGIWLPETAVGTKVLEIVAAAGLRFTVLASHQGARWREDAAAPWRRGAGEGRRPCRVALPSGREIAVFFYNGRLAHEVAFSGLLHDGDGLAQALLAGFDPDDDRPQLAHLATDGESYGHHHRFGEMALLAALDRLRRDTTARLTNYGEFLALCPAEAEVEIAEFTSWSCSHGVARWRADCGCNSGGHPAWNQAWRAPLRSALEWLRDRIAPEFERAAAALFADPWLARSAYIDVAAEPSPGTPEAQARFLAQHSRAATAEDRARALGLMEMQHNLLRMFTSCGWFFDEVSGLETRQILQYAACGLQAGEALLGLQLREGFLRRLAAAPGNLPEFGTAADVFELMLREEAWALPEVAANLCALALFHVPEPPGLLPAFVLVWSDRTEETVDDAELLTGELELVALRTGACSAFEVAALRTGVHACIALRAPGSSLLQLRGRLQEAGPDALLREMRAGGEGNGGGNYDLAALRDETRASIASALIRRLELGALTAPGADWALPFAAGLIANVPDADPRRVARLLDLGLLRALRGLPVHPDRVQAALDAVQRLDAVPADSAHAEAWEAALVYLAEAAASHAESDAFSSRPAAQNAIETWSRLSALAAASGCAFPRWRLQNCFWRLLAALPAGRRDTPAMRALAESLEFSSEVLSEASGPIRASAAHPSG